MPPNGTPTRRSQQIIAKRFCTFTCHGTSPRQTSRQKWTIGPDRTGQCPWADSKAKKKRKLAPTDRQSGSVHATMTSPRHADKDCLTTEENVTISCSRITRQGHCRCGAASSLVARNHQPTKRRSARRTTGDTRIVACWNLRANVTVTRTGSVQHNGGHARRAALSHTIGVKEKSARNVRARKVRQRIICFLHWCTASRSTNFSRSRSSKRKISIDERKRDAAARLCLDGTDVLSKDRTNGSPLEKKKKLRVWLRHHVFRRGITLDLVTTRVPQQGHTVSDCDTCHLRTTPKSCGTVRSGQGSHNIGGTACLLPGNRTGVSLALLRDVSSDGVRISCLTHQL